MPDEKDKIVEVTIGYSQNFRVNPADPYVMARAEMSLKAQLYPMIGRNMDDVKNGLYQRCKEGVLELIAAEQAAEQFN